MKPRMVVLIVDALGWELACRTPRFAPSLVHRRRIETILGFSAGALPTLFTGRMPAEHGRWLMYRRRDGASPFAGFGWTRALPARVRRSRLLHRMLTRIVERRGVRGYFNLYDVPHRLLPEFDLPERDDPFRPGGLTVESLWDAVERRGIPRRIWSWRTPEADNLRELEALAIAGDHPFLACYTADLDALQHREGTGGAGVRARLEAYGALIERLARDPAARTGALRIYLVSDHGMVDVRATADIMGRLASLPVGWPRDYLAFFDSTMARFWWRGGAARRLVIDALAGEAGGRWLEDSELERYGALFARRDFGEDVFLLEPGTLMLPSFMGSRPVAAMHGYAPEHPELAALLWSNRPVPDSVGRLRDVRGFLEAELDALSAEAA